MSLRFFFSSSYEYYEFVIATSRIIRAIRLDTKDSEPTWARVLSWARCFKKGVQEMRASSEASAYFLWAVPMHCDEGERAGRKVGFKAGVALAAQILSKGAGSGRGADHCESPRSLRSQEEVTKNLDQTGCFSARCLTMSSSVKKVSSHRRTRT